MSVWNIKTDYLPTNIFPPKNLGKGTVRTGNWIEVYQEQIDEIEEKNEVKVKKDNKTVIEPKELNGKEVEEVHGDIDYEYITILKFNGKKFTSVVKDGWEKLNPFAADFSVNFLNLDQIAPFGHKLEILELAFNRIHVLRLNAVDSYPCLAYLDLSWNHLTDSSLEVLSKLQTLEVLNLSGNEFVKFPVIENSFSNLLELRLTSNKLTEHCFYFLARINSLGSLFLNQNKIIKVPLMATEDRRLVLTNLELLDLSDNPISEESSLLPIAACPLLKTLHICRTELVRKHNGHPPLIQKYLINRTGIDIKRNDNKQDVKKKTEFRCSKRSDISEPKFLRSTIEDRIKSYRAELAIESGDAATNKDENQSVVLEPGQENIDSPFFITQETHEQVDETKISDSLSLDIPEQEINLSDSVVGPSTSREIVPDEITVLNLTQQEQEEYDMKVSHLPTQSVFKQLRALLDSNPSKSLVLPRQHPQPPRQQFPDALKRLRDRQVAKVTNLNDCIVSSKKKTRQISEKLFAETKKKFHESLQKNENQEEEMVT